MHIRSSIERCTSEFMSWRQQHIAFIMRSIELPIKYNWSSICSPFSDLNARKIKLLFLFNDYYFFKLLNINLFWNRMN